MRWSASRHAPGRATNSGREYSTDSEDDDSPKPVADATRKWLTERMYYLSGDFQSPETFQRLRKLLGEIDHRHNTDGNYLFYVSTAPQFFSEIPQQLDRQKLTNETDGSWRRLIVESPMGEI